MSISGPELLELTEELESYYDRYASCFARSEGRVLARVYAQGQLGEVERKSLEPIADRAGISPRSLQLFFTRNGWDEEQMLCEYQQQVAQELEAGGIFVVDETSDAKKGDWTAGVGRQYCGESGKIDNCIVSVHTAYVSGEQHTLLDGTLFMPEDWDSCPSDHWANRRRERAQVPETVRHQPKTDLSLAQTEQALSRGIAGRYVSADALYGGSPSWRKGLDELELIYVVEVPCRLYGRLNHDQAQAQTIAQLVTHPRVKAKPVKRYTVHDTHKGPEVWACRQIEFIEQATNAPACRQRLLIAHNERTGETKYFLSNAPKRLSMGACLKVAFTRWRIERCFQDCKSELGMNHAELRTYRGLRRHFILTAINYYFLLSRVRQMGEKRPHRFSTR